MQLFSWTFVTATFTCISAPTLALITLSCVSSFVAFNYCISTSLIPFSLFLFLSSHLLYYLHFTIALFLLAWLLRITRFGFASSQPTSVWLRVRPDSVQFYLQRVTPGNALRSLISFVDFTPISLLLIVQIDYIESYWIAVNRKFSKITAIGIISCQIGRILISTPRIVIKTKYYIVHVKLKGVKVTTCVDFQYV